jgi:sulfite reductase (NADPH) flavoprotein alpha-component
MLYIALCARIFYREWIKRKESAKTAASFSSAITGADTWLIAYGSQTGNAEQLAWQTAQALHAATIPAQIISLAQLNADTLQNFKRALFITSTYGEGDPPDNATIFSHKVMGNHYSLDALQYAVLALGDRQYKNFCGFGRQLDQWLQAQGAQALYPRIDVSNSDPTALAQWREQLSHITGTELQTDWQEPGYESWQLVLRQHMNPGSAGNPVYHIELAPPDNNHNHTWQAGDLVQVLPPSDPERPREYSIASIPADGRVHLLIRQERHADGSLGISSGWLTQQAALNSSINLRIRPHRNFRLEDNINCPLILIGNGTGLAGLRALLKERIAHHKNANWLIFGERNAAFDRYYQNELTAWQQQGLLEAHLVFSRDDPKRRYVQDHLRDKATQLREWLAQGAAIYVCGSLEGMASGVDAALKEIIGEDAVQQLIEQGRYRRDVY